MQEIIDIHAHILPGLDDGAFNMEEAQAMLQLAYSQGICKIIATPHYKRGQNRQFILEAGQRLQEKAYEINSQYQILLGQEILYFEDMMDDLRENKIFTMCQSRYLLIEFDPRISYSMMLQSLRKIIFACYIPILAHMERYLCLREKGKVEELIRSGCMLQMNYCSIIGTGFSSDIRWCRNQIRLGYVHMMGTDMHHYGGRGPEIKKALKWIRKHCGMDTYQKLVRGNAEEILKEKKQFTGDEHDSRQQR